jgi:hypothetical protein
MENKRYKEMMKKSDKINEDLMLPYDEAEKKKKEDWKKRKLPRKLKIPITVDVEIDTMELFEKLEWCSKPKFSRKLEVTDEWFKENWKKIIENLTFVYNKWDGIYNPSPHPRFKNEDGSPLMIKHDRDGVWGDRRDRKKRVTKEIIPDVLAKRFLMACFNIEDEQKDRKFF